MTAKKIATEKAKDALALLGDMKPKPPPELSIKDFVQENRAELIDQIKRLGEGNDVWGRKQVCEALNGKGIDIAPDRLRDLLRRRRKKKEPESTGVKKEEIDQVQEPSPESITESAGNRFFKKVASQ